MYELAVSNAAGQVLKRYDLGRLTSSGGRVVIGRSDGCDIRIPSGQVSRRHCVIEAIGDDEWVIRDLDSTHGCVVDGAKVREAEIEEGLEVRLGPAVLRFSSIAARIAQDLERELGDIDETA
jgi:pSer/pThr/pTyr-binding forkhead associated (FHA) protein